ncbi:metal cation zip family protein [Cystoisospora suis]|uniref:Metal cation zip family protein n=1 Tax=Cystoisospora suis TaxID=483139 RepID=A0A2C6KIK8_9APIC|nr:metal cation zip family protein [Cystoisospora suis]
MRIDLPDWQIAGIFALFSSATFPLGALLGLWAFALHRKLNRRLLGFFLSVGAGSLIFAVAVEVYAEGLEAIEHIHTGDRVRTIAYIVQIAFAVVGALLYVWLDRQVNRIRATVLKHARKLAFRKAKADADVLRPKETTLLSEHREALSGRRLSEDVAAAEQERAAVPGPVAAGVGDDGLGASGESGAGQSAIEAAADAEREQSISARDRSSQSSKHGREQGEAVEGPMLKYLTSLSGPKSPRSATLIDEPTVEDEELHLLAGEGARGVQGGSKIRENKEGGPGDHLGVALVLWTSQFVDAIPEAMMIGFRVVGNKLSWAFIISIFIANFPESFCGGYMMKKEGFGSCLTFVLWLSVSLLIGLVAMGTAAIQVTPAHSVALRMFDAGMQGTAAGAMLALSTASMLPAAYEAGGISSGVFCVLGFLFSLSVRLFLGVLEGPVPLGQEAGIIEHATKHGRLATVFLEAWP